MKVRVVVQSTSDEEEQYLNFTVDFDLSQEDLLFPNCSIDIDEVIEMDVESIPGFPLEYSFERIFFRRV